MLLWRSSSSRVDLHIDLPVLALPSPREEVQAVAQDVGDVQVFPLSQDRRVDGAGEARLDQRDVPDRLLLEEVLGDPRLRVQEPDPLGLPSELEGGEDLRRGRKTGGQAVRNGWPASQPRCHRHNTTSILGNGQQKQKRVKASFLVSTTPAPPSNKGLFWHMIQNEYSYNKKNKELFLTAPEGRR